MKLSFLTLSLIALAIVFVSCSGRSSIPPALMPNVSGSWEFVAASSTNPGYSTGIDVALQEGQALVDGLYQPNGQISAAGQQINFVGFTPTGSIVFGGNCAAATVDVANSVNGNISGLGGAMNFTYTENGNIFNVTAVLDASSQFIDSGTYTEQAAQAGQSNGRCNGNLDPTVIDTGSITGKIVARLSGIYTGQICQPLDTSCANAKDTATATLSQSGTTLTVNLQLTGTDNTSFTLIGPVAGNTFSVQGTFHGTSLSYYGYYEVPSSNLVPSLYLVNATNSPSQPTYAGTLTVPQTPGSDWTTARAERGSGGRLLLHHNYRRMGIER